MTCLFLIGAVENCTNTHNIISQEEMHRGRKPLPCAAKKKVFPIPHKLTGERLKKNLRISETLQIFSDILYSRSHSQHHHHHKYMDFFPSCLCVFSSTKEVEIATDVTSANQLLNLLKTTVIHWITLTISQPTWLLIRIPIKEKTLQSQILITTRYTIVIVFPPSDHLVTATPIRAGTSFTSPKQGDHIALLGLHKCSGSDISGKISAGVQKSWWG